MISKAQKEDSLLLAQLHHQTINQGFLYQLGIQFLQSLYRYLIIKELVFVYQEDNKVLGFVSCALSSKGIMTRFLLSSSSSIFQLAFALLKNPKLMISALETFRAPSLSETALNSDRNT